MPPANDDVQQAVDIAVLQTTVVNLAKSVDDLSAQVKLLVQAQIGAKWLGGAVVYLVPIASAIISAIAFFKTGSPRP